MLHREQLSYKINSSSIKPRFIDPDSPFLLDLAEELIRLYSAAQNGAMSRGELTGMTTAMIRNCNDVKIASGLNKLLLDRCGFSPAINCNYPESRQQSFLLSAQMLNSGNFSADTLQQCAVIPDLYGDLPDFEKLLTFKDISAAALLHRYNLALAQGLLIYADSVELSVCDPAHDELRKLLKAIKFFRLLGHFRHEGKNTLHINISGPYSLFGTSAKYALQLANLLPAVVNLKQWHLTALINIKHRKFTLKLSHKNLLVSHYRSLAGYIPPEISLFHRMFNEKQSDWQIIGDTPFIDGGNQQIIFPDLSFRHQKSGKIIHAELFHRWHAAELKQRINLIRHNQDLPLLLGIDRSLVKNETEFNELFDHDPSVREKCWLFRDFPAIATTVKLLNKII